MGTRPETVTAVDRKVLDMQYSHVVVTKIGRTFTLGLIILGAVFALIAVATLGGVFRAFAQPPFDAPNPGDFASGSLHCETHLGGVPSENWVRTSFKWRGGEDSLFGVYLLDKNMEPVQFVRDESNRQLTYILDGVKQQGSILHLEGWSGNSNGGDVTITMSGIAPDQFYSVAAVYVAKASGNNVNYLTTASAAAPACVITD